LFVIGMEAEALLNHLPEGAKDREKAFRIRRIASRATAELRSAIAALASGPVTGKMPLPTLLQELVDEFEKLANIEITLLLPSEWPELAPRVTQAIYRIVREALANIQKHAQATAAIVSITVRPDRLLVSIQDNGVGFPANMDGFTSNDLHFGMRTMHQLADHTGGYLEAINHEDGGALVRFSLPFKSWA
jgi:signal transduction histidine kinase